MKKRLISLFLMLCMAVSLFCCSAYAAKDYSAYVNEVVIAEGDTLSSICEARNMDFYKVLKAIKIVNGLTDASSLDAVRAGQKFYIPKTAADAETIVKLYEAVVSAVIPASYVCKYTVKSGDTLYSICQNLKLTYNICKDSIISLNEWSGGKDLTTIYEGQTIIFPVNDSAAKEISATIAKAVDMNINISTNSQDKFEFYLVEYTLSSGESIKAAVTQLGIEYTDDIAAKVKAINGINDLSKVQAGKKYLLPSATADNVKYAIYSHKVVSGDTSANLCASMGAEYAKVSDMLTALNTKASFPAIKKGTEVLLAAPRGGEQGKTPIVIK
ncbi:MAG: LysM peptidoglycan-binding domain-containing protein [Eubacteriales bacterium]|nr:LysM peptidoglycan-binding domain-containing protein [Eubacteriales bacterium]